MNRANRTALAGGLAAASALTATELVNLLAPTGPSLLIAVETWFVDAFAGSLKDLAVALFGTGDKAALAIGAVLVALGLGVLAARLEVRWRWAGVGVIAAFSTIGVVATVRHSQGNEGVAVVAAGLGTLVGSAVLLVLLDRFGVRVAPGAEHLFADRRRPDGAAPADASGSGGSPGADGSPDAGDSPAPGDLVVATRRDVMTWGLGTGAVIAIGAVAAKGTGDALRRSRSVIPDRLPRAVSTVSLPPARPFDAPGLTPYIVPNQDFYRIDTSLQTPYVDTEEWRLRVTGRVDREFELSYADLLGSDLVEEVITLSCVSNEVGGDLVGNATWTGIPLRDLLERAGVHDSATQLVGESVDGFTAGFPTAILDDPDRAALVAVGMNGVPLPRPHGFPARLVVSGVYGYVSATKWLSEIRLTTLEAEDGFWIPRGWAKEAPVKTQSRIDVPRRGDALAEGRVPIAGVAWAPSRGIAKVEVRIDGGDWTDAELGEVTSDHTWVQWYLAWDAPPGDHRIEVRATDGDGETQGARPVPPGPDGAEGWHSRTVKVAAR